MARPNASHSSPRPRDRKPTEGEGFEPPSPCELLVFKTSAIDHSANPPGASETLPRRLVHRKDARPAAPCLRIGDRRRPTRDAPPVSPVSRRLGDPARRPATSLSGTAACRVRMERPSVKLEPRGKACFLCESHFLAEWARTTLVRLWHTSEICPSCEGVLRERARAS